MKLLLTELLRCDAHQTGTPERLQLVMQYLQANYAKPITLSQLAALEHVSVSYLSRQFRRYTERPSLRISTSCGYRRRRRC